MRKETLLAGKFYRVLIKGLIKSIPLLICFQSHAQAPSSIDNDDSAEWKWRPYSFENNANSSSPGKAYSNDTYILKLMANPVKNTLRLSYNSYSMGNLSIYIMDLSGKIVCTARRSTEWGINNISVDISNLVAGFYLIKVVDNNERPLYSKFIKE